MGKIWRFIMDTARNCLSLPCRCVHYDLTSERWKVVEQFLKFLLVGCSNTVVVLVVYYITISMLGVDKYLLGQTLGYIVGILNSYFWNSRYVFSQGQTSSRKAFLKMCVCYGVTYVIQAGLLYILVDLLHISEFISPIIAIIVTTPINFILNRLFAFNNR